jgi:hypothetical protein
MTKKRHQIITPKNKQHLSIGQLNTENLLMEKLML